VTVTIRRAGAKDAPALSEIARAAKARWGYPREWLEVWDADLTISVPDIERMAVFVADSTDATGRRPVGVAAIERRTDDWSLEHFWILPSVEGRGIGRVLFTHVLREVGMNGGTAISIVSDPNAVGFYERMGAHVQNRVPAPMPGAPARALERLTLILDSLPRDR
jgi:ribosomal protein S18 acetylase RimI-like enzyme